MAFFVPVAMWESVMSFLESRVLQNAFLATACPSCVSKGAAVACARAEREHWLSALSLHATSAARTHGLCRAS
jgi:hypothetical protein